MSNKKLRVYLSVILLTCLISPLAFSAEEQVALSPVISLKEAVLIAFRNNKDIQIQEKQINVASANILEAKSRFLPKIDLNASYTHNDKVLAENIYSGYHNDNILGLSYNQSVLSGGANIANLRQAQLGLTAEKETLRAKKLDVEFEVKRLFYGLLLAYESERIARQALEQAKSHYENVKQMFNQGRTSRFDVLQSEVRVSLLVPELVRTGNEIDTLKAELNKELGRKVDVAIETEEKLGYTSLEIKEADFLKSAYLERPEIKLKSLGIDINKWEIEMAKSGYRPELEINANYNYRSNNPGNIINSKQRNWNTGASLRVPIFEGFSTKAKVDAARARYAQAKLDKDNLSDQIAVDIRKACLNLKDAESIINSQKDNVGEAGEALRISEVSYANGVAMNLDVLDAQVSLAQIEKNLAESIYDYLMAEAYLDRSIGRLYFKEADNEKQS